LLRPLGEVIVVMPPLAIGHEQLGTLVDAVYRAIAEVTSREPYAG
jgi:adenosylmethionine-8-amino-7-oxononanoate aminotransferase